MSVLDVFFLRARSSGQRLCVHHAPRDGPLRSAVVYVHPFAEEMNKSRRMAALAAATLARAGHAVLQIDLLGCGDSSGDFGDASWDDWLDDVALAARWMRERHPGAPLCLWGLRVGCLLAAQAAQPTGASRLLFWQPTTSGKAALQQFLRLKLGADIVQAGASKGSLAPLRQALASGNAVDVAGYRLSPGLAHGLEQANLAPPSGALGRLDWLELGSPDALSPAAGTALERWRQAGWQTNAAAVAGTAFWHTSEIEVAPALIDASVAALRAPTLPQVATT